MRRQGDEIHLDTEEARAGSTRPGLRWVLGIGLALAVVALSAIWITGAMTSPQAATNDPVSNQPTPNQ